MIVLALFLEPNGQEQTQLARAKSCKQEADEMDGQNDLQYSNVESRLYFTLTPRQSRIYTSVLDTIKISPQNLPKTWTEHHLHYGATICGHASPAFFLLCNSGRNPRAALGRCAPSTGGKNKKHDRVRYSAALKRQLMPSKEKEHPYRMK